jgi:hypothetical protein
MVVLVKFNFIKKLNQQGFSKLADLKLANNQQRRFKMTLQKLSGYAPTTVDFTFGLNAKIHNIDADPTCTTTHGNGDRDDRDADVGDADDENDHEGDDEGDDECTSTTAHANVQQVDYVVGGDACTTEQCVVLDNDIDSDPSMDDIDTDISDSGMAPEELPWYGTMTETPDFLLGFRIVKFSTLLLYRNSVRGRNVHKNENISHRCLKVHPNTLVAIAVHCAVTAVQENAILDGKTTRAEYEAAADIKCEIKPQGWARRPKHGNAYGAKYIGKYTHTIVELFNRGVRNKSEKLGPAQMRNCLRKLHPDSLFSLPSEAEISSFIARLTQKSKKSVDGIIAPASCNGGKRGRKSKLSKEIVKFIGELVTDDPTIKPKSGVLEVRAQFPDLNEEFYKSVKNKISNLKTKLK